MINDGCMDGWMDGWMQDMDGRCFGLEPFVLGILFVDLDLELGVACVRVCVV